MKKQKWIKEYWECHFNAGVKMKSSTKEWVINKAFDLYEESIA